ncbi:MAG: hypothetical protein M3Y87_22965 [Myxococcota bacterium]|nr:hypothetical protein [Myxococcota bacterium]
MATWDPKGLVLEPADIQEAPYRGRAGATRVESVHVPLAGGTLRTVAVHRAVDVGTDPQLREVVLGGRLHRLDGDLELAVPFVYHDPSLRKLALVLPEALRHEELRERARLLEKLADDTTVPVPRYAAEATVVIGLGQLSEYLAGPSARAARAHDEAELQSKRKELGAREQDLLGREEILGQREETIGQREEALARREAMLSHHEPSLAQREQALDERERAVSQREHALTPREHRMRERAEDVTRREDELAGLSEEHEAAQRDIAMREQELEQRLESLVQRERELADRLSELERRADASSARDLVSAPAPRISSLPPPAPAAIGLGISTNGAMAEVHVPLVAPVLPDEVASIDDEDDVEELDDLEPIRTNPAIAAEPMAISSTLEEGVAIADDAVEEIVDDDDVEEEVDDDDIEAAPDGEGEDDAAAGQKTMIAAARDVAPAPSDAPAPTTDPGIVAPAELCGDVEMVARFGEGVELYVALGDSIDAFEHETDLLIQLAVLDGCPVVVLALVDPTGARPFVRRAAFDPRSPEGRRLLEALRRRFEARTILFGVDGRFLRIGRVVAPRELNASRTLDRVVRLRAESAIDPATAIERALAAPPPISGANPFAGEEEPGRLDSPARAAAALAEIAEWAAPEKMDHALLVLSVPRDTIDATFARVMERAVEHGIALPPSLVDRALGAGVADDVGGLVAKQLAGFRRTIALSDRGGLDEEAIASNWERLLAGAADAEIAIDPETHDLAWRAIRVVRGENTGSMPGGEVDAARLAEMGAPELVMLLEHPRHRRAAAVALADRGDPELADALCKAVRKMPRAEVVRVVPRITKLGDEAGDALIDGLGARKTFARQAFALALGHLKLRRAVVPLMHLLASEPSDVWREIARVYGTFGNASFRTLSQKLHDPKAPEERYVLTLAHLANHGCAKQIDALQKDADARVAALAVRALSMRDDARRQEELVSGKRPPDSGDGVIAFSRRFVEELEGTAPESDLAAAPGEDV